MKYGKYSYNLFNYFEVIFHLIPYLNSQEAKKKKKKWNKQWGSLFVYIQKSFSEKNFASHMPGRCFGGSAYNKRPWWKIEVWESGSAQERETHGSQKGSAFVKKKKKSQGNLMDWWKQEQRTWHVLEALGFEDEAGISNALSGRLTAGALRGILARVLKWARGGQAWLVSWKQMVYIPVTPRRVSSKRTSPPRDKRARCCLIAGRSCQLTRAGLPPTAYFCFWSFYHHSASS